MDHDPRDDDRDWEGIKHDFIQSGWSVARISERHAVPPSTIRNRAKKYGWVKLVATKPLPTGPARLTPEVPLPKRASVERKRRRSMVRRLLEALDKKMTQLEVRMGSEPSGGEPQSAADAERDARTLAGLARLYAKLVELDEQAQAKAKGTKQGAGAAKPEAPDDADRFRRDLALRLQRLNQSRDAQ